MQCQGVSHEDPRHGFETAVLPYREGLYGAAVRMAGCPAVADDLVQETILRAWLFWASFKSGTNCRAWLHRILVNTFVNHYRRRRREQALLSQVQRENVDPPYLDEEPAVLHNALSDEVVAALSALPEEFQQVLLLVDAHGRSYREAAGAMACPMGTVMSRLHRARRAFREALATPAGATPSPVKSNEEASQLEPVQLEPVQLEAPYDPRRHGRMRNDRTQVESMRAEGCAA